MISALRLFYVIILFVPLQPQRKSNRLTRQPATAAA